MLSVHKSVKILGIFEREDLRQVDGVHAHMVSILGHGFFNISEISQHKLHVVVVVAELFIAAPCDVIGTVHVSPHFLECTYKKNNYRPTKG